MIHIANFFLGGGGGGVVPNLGHFHKLTDSTQDCFVRGSKGFKNVF